MNSESSSQSEQKLKSFIIDSIAEPIVKGTICGLCHLLIFTILRRKFKT
ncbi:hypothetical protein pb186bvf_007926 [Paramecium bursaria]